jgi:formate dehydrogenase major subunit
MMVFGHNGNTIPRMPDAVKAIEAIELLVIVIEAPEAQNSPFGLRPVEP